MAACARRPRLASGRWPTARRGPVLQSCAASRATHLQLAKAAPQIALVGPTPQNLQAERLGVFLKRAELVNGYPSYTMDGDDSAMLWHAGGSWQVGSAADLGQDRGWVSVRDGCSRPEGSTVTWEGYDGADFVDAERLRCRPGRSITSHFIWERPTPNARGLTPDTWWCSPTAIEASLLNRIRVGRRLHGHNAVVTRLNSRSRMCVRT